MGRGSETEEREEGVDIAAGEAEREREKEGIRTRQHEPTAAGETMAWMLFQF